MTEHRFDPVMADRLLDPKREAVIDADWVVQKLNISNKADVLDLGAGNGYFTVPLAKHTKGKVYSVDVEPEVLSLLGIRAQDQGYQNVWMIQAELEDIPLADNIAEAAVAVFVTREIEDRVKAFSEMNRTLKPGSRGTVIDWAQVDGHVGPPLHERLDPWVLIKELKEAGLVLDELIEDKDVYTIFFSTEG